MKKPITHSLSSAELDAVDAHLQFLAAAADQDGRPAYAGGLEAAIAFLAATRREAFKARIKQREAKLQPLPGFPR